MDDSIIRTKKLEAVRASLSSKEILYRNEAAHLVETPTPLTFSILSTLFSYEGALGQAYHSMDLPIQPYEINTYVRYIFGRMYFELYEEETFLHRAMGMKYVITKNRPELQKIGNWITGLPATMRNLVSNSFILSQKSLHVTFAQEIIAKLRDLPELAVTTVDSTATLLSKLHTEIENFNREYSSIIRLAYLGGLLAKKVTPELLQQLSNEPEKEDLYISSVRALGKQDMTVNQLVQDFGNRSFNDFELAAPRWSETPETLETLLQKRNADRAPSNKKTFLTNSQGKELQEIITLKDNLRFYILNRVARLRQLLLRIGATTGLNDSIFYLTLKELETFAAQNLTVLARTKKELFDEAKSYYAPELITATYAETIPNDSKDTIKATSVSVGTVSGELLYISSPTENAKAGKILVFPTAGPEYTHQYSHAIGIIFQTGGVLSHGSIIAREMHLPAVIAHLPQDLSGIIELNATQGQITFIPTP